MGSPIWSCHVSENNEQTYRCLSAIDVEYILTEYFSYFFVVILKFPSSNRGLQDRQIICDKICLRRFELFNVSEVSR